MLLLREGWDVPEVGVVLLLRKFGSRVYGQQVIGRGLRRVRNRGITDEEQQICAIVDHPKLEHQWLWDIFSSKIRENVGVDDTFDEEEDLPDPPPRQELDKPHNLIEIPEESESDEDDEFVVDTSQQVAEPLANWRDVLAGITYSGEIVKIGDQKIVGVEKKELVGDRWKTTEDAPEDVNGAIPIARDELERAVKDGLLSMSERLLDNAGITTHFKGKIYRRPAESRQNQVPQWRVAGNGG